VEVPAVWLIIGVQAAGKSTVADGLAHAFSRGVHIGGGQFYRWVANGWVHPTETGADEYARRLLNLRYRLSAMVADEYLREGFTAVVQDNIYGQDVLTWLRAVKARPRHLVVLRPSVEVVRERDSAGGRRLARWPIGVVSSRSRALIAFSRRRRAKVCGWTRPHKRHRRRSVRSLRGGARPWLIADDSPEGYVAGQQNVRHLSGLMGRRDRPWSCRFVAGRSAAGGDTDPGTSRRQR
jgi:hypothetical protein